MFSIVNCEEAPCSCRRAKGKLRHIAASIISVLFQDSVSLRGLFNVHVHFIRLLTKSSVLKAAAAPEKVERARTP